MAQIIPRGNNKWLVRIFLCRTAEGKKKFHNKIVHGTKKDAQKFARETETKRDLGTLDKPIIEDPTLNDFLDGWLIAFKQKTVRERTYAGYEYVLDRYVRPYLGKDKLSELTPLRIQGLYNELSDAKLSPRTIAFAHSLIRDALNQAVLSRLIEFDPTFSTRRPPRKKKPIAAFTPEEAERFMRAAKSDRLGIVFWFALATGARPEEYLALQWPDLNLDKCEVNINKSIWWPKGGGWKIEEVKTQSSLRMIDLNTTVAHALAGLCPKSPPWCGFGFAAGCEAVAKPRRRGALYIFGLCPWYGLWPNKSEGLSPDQGHSPRNIWLLSAGHSHRLTSGGTAEPNMVHDF